MRHISHAAAQVILQSALYRINAAKAYDETLYREAIIQVEEAIELLKQAKRILEGNANGKN